MTKRTKLKEHLHTLEEIGHIMTAMRNLSLIETGKITQCLALQDQVIKTIHEVSHDFLSFYSMPPMNQQENPLLVSILIGSERGFCGSFNDNVFHQLDAHKEHHSELEPALILVGHKLALKMPNDSRVMATIDGPNAIEEIPAVISNVLHTLEKALLQKIKHGILGNGLFSSMRKSTIKFKQKPGSPLESWIQILRFIFLCHLF